MDGRTDRQTEIVRHPGRYEDTEIDGKLATGTDVHRQTDSPLPYSVVDDISQMTSSLCVQQAKKAII